MDVVDQMQRLGGVTDRATLIRCTSRSAVDRALRRGDIVRDGHGRYALPAAEAALRAANRLSGVVSHPSAAIHRGWAVTRPGGERRHLAPLHVGGLHAHLPFDEALAIADSALRSGDIGKKELIALTGEVKGAGAARRRRVAAEADAKAANPFQSAQRVGRRTKLPPAGAQAA